MSDYYHSINLSHRIKLMISGVRVGDFTTHGKFLVRVVSTKECDGEIAHKNWKPTDQCSAKSMAVPSPKQTFS